MASLITLTELKAEIRDIYISDEDIAAYLLVAPEATDAFAQQVRIDPELVDVLRIQDKVIWYESDTEPESSASPVFDTTT